MRLPIFHLNMSGIHERMVMKIDRRLRLSGYLGANGPLVVGPWLETRTEGMQHQNAFRLWISRLALTQRRQQ